MTFGRTGRHTGQGYLIHGELTRLIAREAGMWRVEGTRSTSGLFVFVQDMNGQPFWNRTRQTERSETVLDSDTRHASEGAATKRPCECTRGSLISTCRPRHAAAKS